MQWIAPVTFTLSACRVSHWSTSSKCQNLDTHVCMQTCPKNFSSDKIHLIWQHLQICCYVTGNLWQTRKRKVLWIILRSRLQDYVWMSHRMICHLDWSCCVAGSNSQWVHLCLCRLFASAKSEYLLFLLYVCCVWIWCFSKMQSQDKDLVSRCKTFTLEGQIILHINLLINCTLCKSELLDI